MLRRDQMLGFIFLESTIFNIHHSFPIWVVQCISKILRFRDCSQMTIPNSPIGVRLWLSYAMLQPGHRSLKRRRHRRSSARTRPSACRRSSWPRIRCRYACVAPCSGAVADAEVGGAPLRAWHMEDGGGGAEVVVGAAPSVDEGVMRVGAAGVPESASSDAECEADSPAGAAGQSTPGSEPDPGAEKSSWDIK
jgi:hypothetical protein